MKKLKPKFNDLFVVNTKIFKDNRGWLKEEFKKKFIKKNLVFTLVSSSKKNVLRGLHMQTKKPQDKFLSVLKGRVLDVHRIHLLCGSYSGRLLNSSTRYTIIFSSCISKI